MWRTCPENSVRVKRWHRWQTVAPDSMVRNQSRDDFCQFVTRLVSPVRSSGHPRAIKTRFDSIQFIHEMPPPLFLHNDGKQRAIVLANRAAANRKQRKPHAPRFFDQATPSTTRFAVSGRRVRANVSADFSYENSSYCFDNPLPRIVGGALSLGQCSV